MKIFNIKKRIAIVSSIFVFGSILISFAVTPSGNYWFQFFTNTITGSDNSGNQNNVADFNYYYVGQTIKFRVDVGIGSLTSNTADFIAFYEKDLLSASNLVALNAYNNSVPPIIDNNQGKISMGEFNNNGIYYVGQRQFLNVDFTMLKPSTYNYGSTSTSLNIDFTIGKTTDSNIAFDGTDHMDSKGDFNMIILADTKKPYGLNPNPLNESTNVSINSNYTFDLRDSKNGEGDNSGYGTGFAVPPTGLLVQAFNGISTTTLTTSSSCSQTFTTLCNISINPNSPLSIAGDNRNWLYDTEYKITVSGAKDRASNNQNQLGDSNGPNTMNTKIWTFKTEKDTIPPYIVSTTPAASSTNILTNATITIQVLDIKSNQISGIGVATNTCKFNIYSPSIGTINLSATSSNVYKKSISYGIQYDIAHQGLLPNFAESENISVNVFDCEDIANNKMSPYIFSFKTIDTGAPAITNFTPLQNIPVSSNTPITFDILDSGTGVDDNTLVIYVDGKFYKKGGGSGSISVSSSIPAKINFSTSTNLSSFMSATSSGDYIGYSININDLNFSAGKSVPVLVFAKDKNENIMNTFITSYSIINNVDGSIYCGNNSTWNGNSCIGNAPDVSSFCAPGTHYDNVLNKCVADEIIVDGSIYCGNNATWNGNSCIGNAPDVESFCNPGTHYDNVLNKCVEILPDVESFCDSSTHYDIGSNTCIANEVVVDGSIYCGNNATWDGNKCNGNIQQVNNYYSNTSSQNVCIPLRNSDLSVQMPFATQVDENSILITWTSGAPSKAKVLFSDNKDNLSNIVIEDNKSNTTFHSVLINNLEVGKLYYFKPVSIGEYGEVAGEVIRMSPKYKSEIKENVVKVVEDYKVSCRQVETINNSIQNNNQNFENTNQNDNQNNNQNTNNNFEEISENNKESNIKAIYIWPIIIFLLGTFVFSIIKTHFIKEILIKNNMKKVIKKIIYLIIIILVLFIIYFNKDYINNLFNNQNKVKYISVSGNILNPLTFNGVKEVYLGAQNILIETAESGSFDFGSINNQEGIEITNSSLNKKILFDLTKIKDSNNLEIFFDGEMFNTLNTYLNFLSQNNFAKANELISEKCDVNNINNNISFKKDFDLEQILNISSTNSIRNYFSETCKSKFERVIEIKVKTNNEYVSFLLVKEKENWKIIN